MAYNTLNYNLSRSFPMQTHFPSPSNAPYPNMGTLELTTNQIDNNLTWIMSVIPLMFGLCASGIHAHTGMDAYILHNSLIFYCQVFVLQLESEIPPEADIGVICLLNQRSRYLQWQSIRLKFVSFFKWQSIRNKNLSFFLGILLNSEVKEQNPMYNKTTKIISQCGIKIFAKI